MRRRAFTKAYGYLVGETAFHFVVADGAVELRHADNPAVTITTDDETRADVASGETTATAAAAAGRLTLVGDRAAVRRLATIFSRSTVLAQAGGLVKSAHSVSSTVRSS
jgi:putative sterol carrier protein